MIIDTTHDFIILTAEEGKVFKNTITGDILTNQIYLGCKYRGDDYIEINEEDAYEQIEEVRAGTVQISKTYGVF